MASGSDPEAFFAALAVGALAKAKAAPTLVEVSPLIGRGWCLGFRVANEPGDIVEVNALIEPGRTLEYSYRPAQSGSPQRDRRLDRVGLLLCKALGRMQIDGELPAVASSVGKVDDEPSPRENISLYLPGECDRGCVFCSVSMESSADRPARLRVIPTAEVSRGRAELESKLRANADRAAEIRIEWSGKDCLMSPLFDDGLRLAYELGYRDMGIQTPGSRLLEDGFITFLREHAVVRVALTPHAGDEATFDQVGGKVGAYRAFWAGFEGLLAESFQISLEVPCVASTVDGLPQHLARLANYECSVTCFFWYPDNGMDDAFTRVGIPYERMIAALEQVRELVPPRRVGVDGVPECMVPSGLRQHFFWRYGDGHMSFLDFVRVPACEGCAARERCPGVTPAYLQHYAFTGQTVE